MVLLLLERAKKAFSLVHYVWSVCYLFGVFVVFVCCFVALFVGCFEWFAFCWTMFSLVYTVCLLQLLHGCFSLRLLCSLTTHNAADCSFSLCLFLTVALSL